MLAKRRYKGQGLACCIWMVTALMTLTASITQGQIFQEKASIYGLDAGLSGHFWGNSVSFVDIDNDGYDDLTFVSDADSLRIYLSTGDGFQQMPSPLLLPPGALHLLWVDYDNDGDLDIFLTVRNGVNRLYQNIGNFEFQDVTVSAGLLLPAAINYGASFGDYDRDGFLDLYICRYYAPEDAGSGGQTNVLFRNNGDGTFSNLTEELGLGDAYKPSFQAVWADINGDLYPDLFVINDRHPANTLFLNNGDGSFSDITESAGVGFPMNDPMSATVGDYNNDGHLDIFFSNGGTSINMPVRLLQNNGNLTFHEVSGEMGIDINNITWGSSWVDLDNDGYQDLFVTTSDLVSNVFYQNVQGNFFSHSNSSLDSPFGRSYVCAKGDFNNDGYADIAVSNRLPDPPFFLENTGGNNHFVKIKAHGTVSNKNAIGTWIKVYHSGQCYVQYTLCGENFVGQDSHTQIFGLGAMEEPVDSVVITYPSGHSDVYYDLDLNTTYHFTEGETYEATITADQVAICPGDSAVLDAGEHYNYLWNTGDTTRYLSVEMPGHYLVTVSNQYGVSVQDSIEIAPLPLPSVSIEVENPKCHGDSTGSIGLNPLGSTIIDAVLWSTGDTSLFIDGLTAGNYTVNIVASSGCSIGEAMSLSNPPELIVLLFVTQEVDGEDGSIFVSVFGGSPPYEYYLDGLPSTQHMQNLGGGEYLVSVVDQNGCTVEEDAFVNSVLSVRDHDASGVEIYPNPARDRVFVKSQYRIDFWRLFSKEGKLIQSGSPMSDAFFIDLSSEPAGIYLLDCQLNPATSVRKKIVKQ